ncbi:MAG: hypothetical protein OEZ23_07200, partial [Gammaproteobacteria bacterium]|nr:hypothetical protein [Gammaproteobacteria bacterium]
MMVSRSHILSVARRDRLIKERVNDPLKSSRKPAKIQVCTVCGLIYKAGRWQHLPATREAFLEFTQCPACLRQRYDLPAGYLTLSGGFLETHETEIRRLVNNVIEQQCHTHPLKRLM